MRLDTSSSAGYSALLDLNNLHEAFLKCKQGVSWKESVQKYELYEFRNINRLRKALINGTYRQKPFYEFDIYERGKPRHIKSLHISDRVLQRALCDYILIPNIRPYLIYDNGASLEGKGIDFSRRRIVTHLQKYQKEHGTNVGYILLMDCHDYFGSLDHKTFLYQIYDIINDEKVCDLVEYLTKLNPGDKGFGIGSQLSQVAGILYLTPLDNFVKNVLHAKYYGRYMDDFYIICEDKEQLEEYLIKIREVMKDLKLELNEKKTQIYRIDKGFTFLKLYHTLEENGRVVRIPAKSGIRRERVKNKKLTKKDYPYEGIEESYRSWRGNVLKYDGYNLVKETDRLFRREFKENGAEISRSRRNRKQRRLRCDSDVQKG